jgi:hypothetical protein
MLPQNIRYLHLRSLLISEQEMFSFNQSVYNFDVLKGLVNKNLKETRDITLFKNICDQVDRCLFLFPLMNNRKLQFAVIYRVKSIYIRKLKPQDLQTICKNHVHSFFCYISA